MIYFKKRKFAVASINMLHGVGAPSARKIAAMVGLHPKASFDSLKAKSKPFNIMMNDFPSAFKQKRHQFVNLLYHAKAGTYRGVRSMCALPVRGQRTHTNANTVRRQHLNGRYYGISMKKQRVFKSVNKKHMAKQVTRKQPLKNIRNKK